MRRGDDALRHGRADDVPRPDRDAGGVARLRRRRHALPQLPGLARGGRAKRGEHPQAHRSRRRKARGRVRGRRRGAGDRAGGDSRDGPPRVHAAVGARARGTPDSGEGRRGGGPSGGRSHCPRGGWRLLHRPRVDADRRGPAGDRGRLRADGRDRSRTGLRRTGARAARHARPERRVQRPFPEALRRTREGHAGGRSALRRGRAGGSYPADEHGYESSGDAG